MLIAFLLILSGVQAWMTINEPLVSFGLKQKAQTDILERAGQFNEALGAIEVNTHASPDRMEIKWMKADGSLAASVVLRPDEREEPKGFNIEVDQDSPALQAKLDDIEHAIVSLAGVGLWQPIEIQIKQGDLPRLNGDSVRSLLIVLALLWAVLILVGVVAAFGGKWERTDAWLLLPILVGVAWCVVTPAVPLDMKLHFLSFDLGRGDLFDIYGFGYPGFQKLIAVVAGSHPAALYTSITLLGLLCLVLLYRLALTLVGKRTFAVLFTLCMASLPLWLRVIRSDSSHVPALFLVLLALNLLTKGKKVGFCRSISIFSALALAMTVRLEFFVLPIVVLLTLALSKDRPRVSRRGLLAAAGLAAVLLVPNYLWIFRLLSWQVHGVTDPGDALAALAAAVTGISRDNLFFHPGYTPYELMMAAWLGCAGLLSKKRILTFLVCLAAAALLMIHPFTLQPHFISVHYQLLAWTVYVALAAHGITLLVELSSRASSVWWRRMVLPACVLALGLMPVAYPVLLSEEPTSVHQEVSFWIANKAKAVEACEILGWRESVDCALKNPENLLEALTGRAPQYVHARSDSGGPRISCPTALYYRGLACFTDPGLRVACSVFERTNTLQAVAVRSIVPQSFAHENYPAGPLEIGLFRIVKKQPAQ